MSEAERLAAGLVSADDHWYAPNCATIDQAAAELRRLQAEVEALQADAERYRWLRETSKKRPEFYSGDEAWMVSQDHGNGTGSNYFGEKIDAAIDAARAK